MTTSSIAQGIVSIIKAPINAVAELWQFLLTPLFTIDLSFLNNAVLSWFTGIDYQFGTYDVNFLFFFSGLGVIVFIILKIIQLINPIG